MPLAAETDGSSPGEKEIGLSVRPRMGGQKGKGGMPNMPMNPQMMGSRLSGEELGRWCYWCLGVLTMWG